MRMVMNTLGSLMRVVFVGVLVCIVGMSTLYAACKKDMALQHPNSRYHVLGNGSEVKDKQTGLIWQRCSLGQVWATNTCIGSATAYTWNNAVEAAKAVGKGYRLPNIKELHGLHEPACNDPAINSDIFPNTPSGWYWSASINTRKDSGGRYAWYVTFLQGYSYFNYKSMTYYVRAVRKGK